MATECQVTLTIGKFGPDPSVVTSLIGIKPTRTDVAGQPFRGHRSVVSKATIWYLDSPLGRRADLHKQLEALLAVLGEREAAVSKVTSLYHAEIECRLTTQIEREEDRIAVLILPNNQLQLMTRLGLDFTYALTVEN